MSVKLGIIGAAGTLGSCAAFAIASRGLVDELVLMDLNKKLLKSHQMDLETAVTPIKNMTIRTGGAEDLSGCQVVIQTAGAPWRQISSRAELLEDNLPIIRETAELLKKYCPAAVVISATNPVDPLNYALYRATAMDRKQLIGYTINDSIRFRMLAARALGVDSTEVQGTVVGEHGEHQVLLFSSVRVKGEPVSFSEDAKQQIRAEIPKILHAYESLGTGRTSGWTSAVGLADMVRAIVQDTGQIFPCSVILAGEYGQENISTSVPVSLGRGGVIEIPIIDMTAAEKADFEETVVYLHQMKRQLEEIFG
jgi:malate/lactate dehydrogenase